MKFRPANRRPPSGIPRAGMGAPLPGKASALFIVFVLFAFMSGSALSHAETAPSREYQVKAAILYSIIKFVEWPNIGSAAAGTPLCVAILGQDPFGDDLEIIQGKF